MHEEAAEEARPEAEAPTQPRDREARRDAADGAGAEHEAHRGAVTPELVAHAVDDEVDEASLARQEREEEQRHREGTQEGLLGKEAQAFERAAPPAGPEAPEAQAGEAEGRDEEGEGVEAEREGAAEATHDDAGCHRPEHEREGLAALQVAVGLAEARPVDEPRGGRDVADAEEHAQRRAHRGRRVDQRDAGPPEPPVQREAAEGEGAPDVAGEHQPAPVVAIDDGPRREPHQ